MQTGRIHDMYREATKKGKILGAISPRKFEKERGIHLRQLQESINESLEDQMNSKFNRDEDTFFFQIEAWKFSERELKDICRSYRLRGWKVDLAYKSELKRDAPWVYSDASYYLISFKPREGR
jgi:hypothetical protein